ncbi:MAG TPA: hypothetical protein VGD43_23190 [Micromonospora sp.]
MLAYCVGYRVGRGHLVHVASARPPVRHTIGNAGVEIVSHALDLDATPAELLTRIAVLADEIAGAVSRPG